MEDSNFATGYAVGRDSNGGYGNNGIFGNDWAWIVILLLFGYGGRGLAVSVASVAVSAVVLAVAVHLVQHRLICRRRSQAMQRSVELTESTALCVRDLTALTPLFSKVPTKRREQLTDFLIS